MATNNASGDQSAQSDQAQLDEDTNLAGLTAAFGKLAELGPQVVTLQGTLLDGIARAQRREMERLSKRYGKDDPRIALANARVQFFGEIRDEVTRHADQVSTFVDGMRSQGSFHGYVYHSDGSAADGYTVRAEVNDPAQKGVKRGKTKTDANGYFRIDMSGAYQKTDQRSAGLDRVAEILRRTETPATAPGAETAPPANGTPGKTGATKRVAAKVEVLDSTGRVVLEDPIPPTFEALNSEFRLYALDGSSKETPAP
jgi:hypothetical protein